MWCFFDESYRVKAGVSCSAACLMHERTVRRLDMVLYRSQREHFSNEIAKDLDKELKGQILLSNSSFRYLKKDGYSKNHRVVEQVLRRCCHDRQRHPILLFGAAIYGAHDVLKQVGPGKRIAYPVADMLQKISVAAIEMNPRRRVNLVFDEQLGSKAVAISIRKFVAGTNLKNVSHYPLIGVSHVTPAIQLADIASYIIAKRAVGDMRFENWLTMLRNFEWVGTINGNHRWGIQRWENDESGNFQVRHRWE